MFIAGATSSETMFTVNTPVASARETVSLGRSVCRPPEKITVGGLDETRLKNEKGARLLVPSSRLVPIQPMGRGTMRPESSL